MKPTEFFDLTLTCDVRFTRCVILASNSAEGEHEEAQLLAHYWEYHANTAASEAQTYQNKSESTPANKVNCGCALICGLIPSILYLMLIWRNMTFTILMSAFCCRCFHFKASWGVTGINFPVSAPTQTVKRVPSVKSAKKALWVRWRALSIVPEASLQLQECAQKGRAWTLHSLHHEMCLTPAQPPFTASTPRNRPDKRPERRLSVSRGHMIV